MTIAPNYLTSRLVRLNALEDWANPLDVLSMLVVTDGAAKFNSGPVTQQIAPGDVLVVSGAFSGKLLASQIGTTFSFFSVAVETLFPLFAAEEIASLQSIVDCFKPLKLYPAASPLAQQCQRLIRDVPPQPGLDHRAHLLRVASVILAAEFRTCQGQRTSAVKVEDNVIRIFEELPVADLLRLSVGELAVKFNCSRRHLNRLFHQYFGFSVAALKMEMRLLKAVSLLREPGAKIINVAEQCGFNHLGLFNTCFKKRFGTSPGEWRKNKQPIESQLGAESASAPCHQRLNGLCPWAADGTSPMERKASKIFDEKPRSRPRGRAESRA